MRLEKQEDLHKSRLLKLTVGHICAVFLFAFTTVLLLRNQDAWSIPFALVLAAIACTFMLLCFTSWKLMTINAIENPSSEGEIKNNSNTYKLAKDNSRLFLIEVILILLFCLGVYYRERLGIPLIFLMIAGIAIGLFLLHHGWKMLQRNDEFILSSWNESISFAFFASICAIPVMVLLPKFGVPIPDAPVLIIAMTIVASIRTLIKTYK